MFGAREKVLSPRAPQEPPESEKVHFLDAKAPPRTPSDPLWHPLQASKSSFRVKRALFVSKKWKMKIGQHSSPRKCSFRVEKVENENRREFIPPKELFSCRKSRKLNPTCSTSVGGMRRSQKFPKNPRGICCLNHSTCPKETKTSYGFRSCGIRGAGGG